MDFPAAAPDSSDKLPIRDHLTAPAMIVPLNPNAPQGFEFDHHAAAIDAVHEATALMTAPQIVDGLLTRIGWPGREGSRLLDPSAGDGSFIVRALARIPVGQDDLLSVAGISGWEFHPRAVIAAREAIRDHLVGRGWSEHAAVAAGRQIIVQEDFLTNGPPDAIFDFIVANPPYLRSTRTPEHLRHLYNRVVPDYAQGDLLNAFLDKCSRILPPNGVIGLVASDRFLGNLTTASLRENLGRHVGYDHLARLNGENCFYRPKYRRAGTPPRIHPVEMVLRPAPAAAFPITRAPINPDTFGQELYTGPTLADVASVKLAPWLGTHGVFVVDGTTASDLRAAGAKLVPVVDTDDIDPHLDTLGTPTRYAIITDREKAPEGAVKDHLLSHLHLLPERARRGSKWWMPPECITAALARESLLVPRICRRLRAIRMPAGTTGVHHNLNVVQIDGGPDLDQLAAWITSEASQCWFRAHAPRLENGYFSVITSMLRRLPVPAANAPDQAAARSAA